ncbi:hypothetical protein LV83_00575 [Algoriphagus yeomjeoni]|uniref:Uncharacterized protein n=1 Tax=Algoriphagus yeomjeoni TaxID=291403 RepID=A0A327PV09_9BACT|nr:hypothetical protein LV83_00575 [Algoriphagus yeomjeoni]
MPSISYLKGFNKTITGEYVQQKKLQATLFWGKFFSIEPFGELFLLQFSPIFRSHFGEIFESLIEMR